MICKHITKRTRNRKPYLYCRTFKKVITFDECKKCLKNEPRANKSINKTSKKKVTVSKETYNKVFERDNGKCRLLDLNCNGKLELHHIRYRSERKDLIDEPSNCIMLCIYHHKLVHSNKHYWQPKLLEIISKIT